MVSRSGMEQMLQGLMVGLGLTLIAYSLIQWRSLREPMFIQYVLMISGSLLFSLHFFGVGAAYLWPDVWWLEARITGISSLMATCGGFLFVSQILYGRDPRSWLLKAMRLAALLTFLFGLAHVADLVDTRAVAAFVSLIGPVPTLLGLPGAWRLVRQRDPIGATLLVAWVIHFATTATIIGVIQGRVPVGFWTLHSFQFGATAEMLLFMYVLGLRARELRITAQMVTKERDAMKSLAHTDALTGIPNRRGLQTALVAALEERPADRIVALFLLDLDGFKPVNDSHGHDMGDELLVAVTRRLQGHVRQSDLVARLGGDEFVVVARHLSSGRQAHELGLKLLQAFESPFALSQNLSVNVGLTIGYALAPEDSTDPMELIRLADAAMYDGKQAGKFCVRRHSGQRVLV
jgi:diguanylate cyclase (GGDEF)-like protein